MRRARGSARGCGGDLALPRTTAHAYAHVHAHGNICAHAHTPLHASKVVQFSQEDIQQQQAAFFRTASTSAVSAASASSAQMGADVPGLALSPLPAAPICWMWQELARVAVHVLCADAFVLLGERACQWEG